MNRDLVYAVFRFITKRIFNLKEFSTVVIRFLFADGLDIGSLSLKFSHRGWSDFDLMLAIFMVAVAVKHLTFIAALWCCRCHASSMAPDTPLIDRASETDTTAKQWGVLFLIYKSVAVIQET